MTNDEINEALDQAPVERITIVYVGYNAWYVNIAMADGRGYYGEGTTALNALAAGIKKMQE